MESSQNLKLYEWDWKLFFQILLVIALVIFSYYIGKYDAVRELELCMMLKCSGWIVNSSGIYCPTTFPSVVVP